MLVGHSYSGWVITVAGASDKVAGLVYVAGFVPDEGESIADLQGRFPSLAMGNFLQPGRCPMGVSSCRSTRSASTTSSPPTCPRTRRRSWRTLSVRSRPPRSRSRRQLPPGERSRSGRVFGTVDQPIAPQLHRFSYERAGSQVTEVEGASHFVMLSQPDAVAGVIREAVRRCAANTVVMPADLTGVPRPPPRRGRGGARAARAVRHAGLPGALRRADAAQPIDAWSFEIRGEVDEPRSWTWEEFTALPSERITVDIHCVTKWSKLDTTWTGVSIDTLLDGVETSAEYVLAFCDGGYTTNLPLEDVRGGKAWVAYEYEDEPLEPEHGGPARLLVPHLYFWKSAKWVRGIELREDDTPGFWEGYGYHNYGDPWKEQRYAGD